MSGASQEDKDLSEGEVSSPESEDESGDQVSEEIDVSTMSPEDRIAYEQARYELLQSDIEEVLAVEADHQQEIDKMRDLITNLAGENERLEEEVKKLRLKEQLDEDSKLAGGANQQLLVQEMTFQVATRGGVVQHIQVVQGTTVVPDLEEDDDELYQGLNARRALEKEKQQLVTRLLAAEEDKGRITLQLSAKQEEAQGLSTRLQSVLAQFKDNIRKQSEVQQGLETERDEAIAEMKKMEEKMKAMEIATGKIVAAASAGAGTSKSNQEQERQRARELLKQQTQMLERQLEDEENGLRTGLRPHAATAAPPPSAAVTAAVAVATPGASVVTSPTGRPSVVVTDSAAERRKPLAEVGASKRGGLVRENSSMRLDELRQSQASPKAEKKRDVPGLEMELHEGVAENVVCAKLKDGHLWMGCKDGKIRVADITKTDTAIATLEQQHGAEVTCLISVGKKMWSGAKDGHLLVWDEKKRTCDQDLYQILKTGTPPAAIVALEIVGKQVWSVSRDQLLRAWDTKKYECAKELATKDAGLLTCMGKHQDEVWIGTMDKILRVNQASFKQLPDSAVGHRKMVTAIISVDANVWSSSEDGTIRIWNDYGRCIHVIDPAHAGPVKNLAFHIDQVWSVSPDRAVHIWDPKSMARVKAVPEAHTAALTAVGFGREPDRLLAWTASTDRRVCLWDVAKVADGSDLGVAITRKGTLRTHKQSVNSRNSSDTVTVLEHKFEKTTFKRPTFCQKCGEFIWGLRNQGFACSTCNYTAHKDCYKKAPPNCADNVSNPSALRPRHSEKEKPRASTLRRQGPSLATLTDADLDERAKAANLPELLKMDREKKILLLKQAGKLEDLLEDESSGSAGGPERPSTRRSSRAPKVTTEEADTSKDKDKDKKERGAGMFGSLGRSAHKHRSSKALSVEEPEAAKRRDSKSEKSSASEVKGAPGARLTRSVSQAVNDESSDSEM